LFGSFCEPVQPKSPHSRGRSSPYISALEFSFIPVETAAPTLKSDGAQLNLGFLLLCVKLHMKFERTPLLKDVGRRFAIEWNVTSA